MPIFFLMGGGGGLGGREEANRVHYGTCASGELNGLPTWPPCHVVANQDSLDI